MEKIYRYVNSESAFCEYRFTDGRLIGFFVGDEEKPVSGKGEELTDLWHKNLTEAGFKLINQ